MARVNQVQTNFTAGEISPKCFGRIDVARYQNGAESLENCIVNIHGGAERRLGTLFVAESKDSSKKSILVPFVYSTTQAYQLEFGDEYMRVFLKSSGQVLSGGVPYEIATPFTEEMLSELDYTQGADTMFIFHNSILTHTLKRLASDNWFLQPAPFTVMPFDEVGHMFSTALTLSDGTVGTGRTVTAGAGVFLLGDIGRRITHTIGIATITAYTDASHVTVTVDSAFQQTTLPSNEWRLEDSPQVILTPSAKSPVGSVVTLTSTIDAFRDIDAGKFIEINSGLIKVDTFTNAKSVSGTIEAELSATVGSPASAWTLEASVWNAANGYPCTGVFYEQRLVVAGSPKYPQTLWGSRSALYYDFTLGDDDNAAFSFTLPTTGQINPILRLAASSSLIPLTYGGEFTMEGGIEKPLTPTNVRSRPRSTRGCKNIKPVLVDNELIIVQRSGRKVRALSYDADSAKYAIPNLTTLAEHITESGIVDMAYQQEPWSLIKCVRSDGKIATLALDRDEGVTAWTPFNTDGSFERVSSNPGDVNDEVWTIVKRTINGETKRYIERFSTSVLTDCAIVGSSVTGKKVWGGLGHLEGKSADVSADGFYMGRFTVENAEITLWREAFKVEIGLPYRSRVKLLRPEAVDGQGSAQASNMRTHEVSILLEKSVGATINGNEIPFQQFGSELLDKPPVQFSGFKNIGTTGWMKGDSPIEITQERPFPFHLLAVVRKFTSNS